MRGWRTPMAVCSVVFGGSVRLRHSVRPREAAPASVATSARHRQRRGQRRRERGGERGASIRPEAMPSSAKFHGVSGVAHSRMAFTAA